MNAGDVELEVLRSDALGGHHTGKWTGDFTASPPKYTGGGVLQKVSMEQLSTLMHENWASGLTSGKYAISMQGKDVAALLNSVTGSADFTWTSGSLRKLALDGNPAPLTFASLVGIINVGGGKLTFDNCEMKTAAAIFNLKGTATYDRKLSFTLQRSGGTSYAVAGSLDQPEVTAVPTSTTQAQLQ